MQPLPDGPPPGDRPDDAASEEESGWLFTAVGLNGRTRTVRVDRLRGAVRLLTPADGAPGIGSGGAGVPPLPHAFIWNAETRAFEPIEPARPPDADA
jgi:hypothetical protein